MLQSLFIYCLYIFILLCSLWVWLARSAVLAVFFLALVFALTALFFFIIGAEFLAILLLVIYSGALILLFLFVIFLLNLRVVELYNNISFHLPLGVLLGLFFCITCSTLLAANFSSDWSSSLFLSAVGDTLFTESNLMLFGFLLYEHLGFLVIGVAVMLLTIMCAIIALSLGSQPQHLGQRQHLAIGSRPLVLRLWSSQKSPKSL